MTNNLDDFVSSYDGLDPLKSRLEYFFMDPLKKWKKKNTRPWKLLVQIIKIVVFTTQLLIFGSDMARFMNYKDKMQISLKQMLLKDWDPSADAVPYPGPYIPYASYSENDFVSSVNFAINEYSNISRLSSKRFRHQSRDPSILSPVEICVTSYAQADPANFNHDLPIQIDTRCKTIQDYAQPGAGLQSNFDFRHYMDFDFLSLVFMTINLPLRTSLIGRAKTASEIVCFNVDAKIFYDNRDESGQIITGLSGAPKRASCGGDIDESSGPFDIRSLLNAMVVFFCFTSFTLCVRSIWRAFKLSRYTEKVLISHGRTLERSDKMEFIDFWLVLIIINDLLVGSATVIILSSDERLLETNKYIICSILLGFGNLLSWFGLLRYLSYFRGYNLLIITVRKSFLPILRFMTCTIIVYCGFCFFGWVVLSSFHYKFRELSTTTECLFSLINGDDMFETFALLKSDSNSIWWLNRIYLYSFVSLFIYWVLSLFIALIMDDYEELKQYREKGFPKSRLESFYLDGDLTKLALAPTRDSPTGSRARLL